MINQNLAQNEETEDTFYNVAEIFSKENLQPFVNLVNDMHTHRLNGQLPVEYQELLDNENLKDFLEIYNHLEEKSKTDPNIYLSLVQHHFAVEALNGITPDTVHYKHIKNNLDRRYQKKFNAKMRRIVRDSVTKIIRKKFFNEDYKIDTSKYNEKDDTNVKLGDDLSEDENNKLNNKSNTLNNKSNTLNDKPNRSLNKLSSSSNRLSDSSNRLNDSSNNQSNHQSKDASKNDYTSEHIPRYDYSSSNRLNDSSNRLNDSSKCADDNNNSGNNCSNNNLMNGSLSEDNLSKDDYKSKYTSEDVHRTTTKSISKDASKNDYTSEDIPRYDYSSSNRLNDSSNRLNDSSKCADDNNNSGNNCSNNNLMNGSLSEDNLSKDDYKSKYTSEDVHRTTTKSISKDASKNDYTSEHIPRYDYSSSNRLNDSSNRLNDSSNRLSDSSNNQSNHQSKDASKNDYTSEDIPRYDYSSSKNNPKSDLGSNLNVNSKNSSTNSTHCNANDNPDDDSDDNPDYDPDNNGSTKNRKLNKDSNNNKDGNKAKKVVPNYNYVPFKMSDTTGVGGVLDGGSIGGCEKDAVDTTGSYDIRSLGGTDGCNEDAVDTTKNRTKSTIVVTRIESCASANATVTSNLFLNTNMDDANNICKTTKGMLKRRASVMVVVENSLKDTIGVVGVKWLGGTDGCEDEAISSTKSHNMMNEWSIGGCDERMIDAIFIANDTLNAQLVIENVSSGGLKILGVHSKTHHRGDSISKKLYKKLSSKHYLRTNSEVLNNENVKIYIKLSDENSKKIKDLEKNLHPRTKNTTIAENIIINSPTCTVIGIKNKGQYAPQDALVINKLTSINKITNNRRLIMCIGEKIDCKKFSVFTNSRFCYNISYSKTTKVKLILLIFLLTFLPKIGQAEEVNILEVATEDSDEDLDELNGGLSKYNYEKLDPFMNYNKKVFRFNMFLFRNTMLPTIFWVDEWVPRPVKTGYHNFLKNLSEPRNYLIHFFRHDKKKMRLAAKRFAINTTFGALGIIDVAGRKYDNHSKTMSFDCVLRLQNKAGRYMVSPVTNQYYERMFTSNIFDWLTNPLVYVNFPLAVAAYTLDQAIALAPNKKLLYKYRNYSVAGYETLRNIETENTFGEEFCR